MPSEQRAPDERLPQDVSLTLGQRMYLLGLLDHEPTPFPDWGRNRRMACRAKLLASIPPEQRHALNLAEPDPGGTTT